MIMPFITKETSLLALAEFVFPDLSLFDSDPRVVMKRVLLTPKNSCVDILMI
jgi:hypothetical protein